MHKQQIKVDFQVISRLWVPPTPRPTHYLVGWGGYFAHEMTIRGGAGGIWQFNSPLFP